MDDVKIFKEFLARVTESSNKPNDGHKQQLIRSSNELIDMYVQAKQKIEHYKETLENIQYYIEPRKELSIYLETVYDYVNAVIKG